MVNVTILHNEKNFKFGIRWYQLVKEPMQNVNYFKMFGQITSFQYFRFLRLYSEIIEIFAMDISKPTSFLFHKTLIQLLAIKTCHLYWHRGAIVLGRLRQLPARKVKANRILKISHVRNHKLSVAPKNRYMNTLSHSKLKFNNHRTDITLQNKNVY